MSWLTVAIGAGAGVLKAELVDKPKENSDRQLAAQTQRYAPWTGNKAGPIRYADPVGSGLQFGMMAGSMKQGMQNSDNQKKIADGLAGSGGGASRGVGLSQDQMNQMKGFDGSSFNNNGNTWTLRDDSF